MPFDGRPWGRRTVPVLAGAIVGLVTGIIGVLATTQLGGSPIGGLVGAVGCGITAVFLSDGPVSEALVNALVADVLSSIGFVFLFLGSYLSYIWFTEGLTPLSAASFSFIFLGYVGLGIAVPVGIISLCITGISGTVTALAMRLLGQSETE